MIETPSDLLTKEVDFFSICTNDLTQYTLATDCQTAKIDNIYNSHHEVVLRMIQMIVDIVHKEGIWVNKCFSGVEYSNAIVHAFQKFRAPFSGKIVHIFPEQSAVI